MGITWWPREKWGKLIKFQVNGIMLVCIKLFLWRKAGGWVLSVLAPSLSSLSFTDSPLKFIAPTPCGICRNSFHHAPGSCRSFCWRFPNTPSGTDTSPALVRSTQGTRLQIPQGVGAAGWSLVCTPLPLWLRLGCSCCLLSPFSGEGYPFLAC